MDVLSPDRPVYQNPGHLKVLQVPFHFFPLRRFARFCPLRNPAAQFQVVHRHRLQFRVLLSNVHHQIIPAIGQPQEDLVDIYRISIHPAPHLCLSHPGIAAQFVCIPLSSDFLIFRHDPFRQNQLPLPVQIVQIQLYHFSGIRPNGFPPGNRTLRRPLTGCVHSHQGSLRISLCDAALVLVQKTAFPFPRIFRQIIKIHHILMQCLLQAVVHLFHCLEQQQSHQQRPDTQYRPSHGPHETPPQWPVAFALFHSTPSFPSLN